MVSDGAVRKVRMTLTMVGVGVVGGGPRALAQSHRWSMDDCCCSLSWCSCSLWPCSH